MVRAQHALLADGLKVNHLRLVLGTSMGAMHCWVWGEMYPDFVDGLVPLASVPTADRRAQPRDAEDDHGQHHAGSGLEERRLHAAAAQGARRRGQPPDDDDEQPAAVAQVRRRPATRRTSGTKIRSSRAWPRPTRTTCCTSSTRRATTIPSPHLEKITAAVLAINSADDVVNPPELGLMEKLMPRVKRGRYVLIPTSDADARPRHALAAGGVGHASAGFLRESDASGVTIGAEPVLWTAGNHERRSQIQTARLSGRTEGSAARKDRRRRGRRRSARRDACCRTQPGRRRPNLMAAHEVFRCARCGNLLSLPLR